MAKRDASELEGIRWILASSMSTSYANLGSVLTSNAIDVYFVNGSDKLMLLSIDGGTKDHFQLPPQATFHWMPGASDHAAEGGIQMQAKLYTAGAPAANTLVSATVTISKSLVV